MLAPVAILFYKWVTSVERYWVTSGEQRSFTESSRLYSPAIVRLIVFKRVDERLPSFTNVSAQ